MTSSCHVATAPLSRISMRRKMIVLQSQHHTRRPANTYKTKGKLTLVDDAMSNLAALEQAVSPIQPVDIV